MNYLPQPQPPDFFGTGSLKRIGELEPAAAKGFIVL